MTTADLTQYWWLLPLLLILACCLSCGRGCCRLRRRSHDEADRRPGQHH